MPKLQVRRPCVEDAEEGQVNVTERGYVNRVVELQLLLVIMFARTAPLDSAGRLDCNVIGRMRWPGLKRRRWYCVMGWYVDSFDGGVCCAAACTATPSKPTIVLIALNKKETHLVCPKFWRRVSSPLQLSVNQVRLLQNCRCRELINHSVRVGPNSPTNVPRCSAVVSVFQACRQDRPALSVHPYHECDLFEEHTRNLVSRRNSLEHGHPISGPYRLLASLYSCRRC